jgi:ribosomal-protein-alanine N-acetyltransferase
MIQIVPLCEEHIEEIAQIENESFKNQDPWSKNMFCELLDNPLAVCFTATEQTPVGVAATPFQKGAVAGYLIAYHILDEIQILNIAVKESKRHRKIATGLFDAVFDCAKIKEIKEFTLEVRPSNIAAINLYKKLGFEIDGIRKNYYAHPKEDAVLMSLKII